MWPGIISQIYAALSGLFSTAAGQSSTAITASASPHGLTFRALRFDGTAAGTVTVTYVKADGTADSGVAQNVSPGEVWPISSNALTHITAISGVTVRALG